MGEYADYEIDRWIGDCRWGGGGRHRSRLPARPTCKRCGQTNLRWQQIKGGAWRLYDTHGTLHDCRSLPSDSCAFEDLT